MIKPNTNSPGTPKVPNPSLIPKIKPVSKIKKDKYGCNKTAGYKWSTILKKCVKKASEEDETVSSDDKLQPWQMGTLFGLVVLIVSIIAIAIYLGNI